MRITEELRRKLERAYAEAGFGLKGFVQINKTTSVEMLITGGGNVMNPATTCTIRKKGRKTKYIHCYSLNESIKAVKDYK